MMKPQSQNDLAISDFKVCRERAAHSIQDKHPSQRTTESFARVSIV